MRRGPQPIAGTVLSTKRYFEYQLLKGSAGESHSLSPHRAPFSIAQKSEIFWTLPAIASVDSQAIAPGESQRISNRPSTASRIPNAPADRDYERDCSAAGRGNQSLNTRPGALSSISMRASCNFATAATRLRPRPLPEAWRLCSSR